MFFRQSEFISNACEDPHIISYIEWGDPANDKILLCVHGLARNSRDFDYLAHELSKYYRIICPDMAGRGNSQWLVDKSKYNYDTYIKDVLALVDHISAKKIDYIGTSMGGIIAMGISVFRSGLIGKVIFNDIGKFIPEDCLKRISRYISIVPIFENMDHAINHMRIVLSKFGIEKEEDWQYITNNSVKLNHNNQLTLAYDPGIAEIFRNEVKDVDLSYWWSKAIFDKILLLRGSLSDVFLKSTAEEMIKSKKNIDYVEFTNIGHVPSLMNNEQISIIKNWLLQ